jgi:hypothetical protein
MLSLLSQRSSFMRALRNCAVGIVAATLVCAYLLAAESQPAAAKTPDLLQRVTTLEEKVARLEKQLADQSEQGYQFRLSPRAPRAVAPSVGAPTPEAPQAPPGIPPNSTPQVFNGQTYYIVPLGKEAAR